MTMSPIGKNGLPSAEAKPAFTAPINKENPLPGIAPRRGVSEQELRNKMHVRYQSFDMRDLGDLAELERIETRALRNEGVYIVDYKNYTFMDKMYYLVKYIEEDK